MGFYRQSRLNKRVDKNDPDLYSDDGMQLLRNKNRREINCTWKKNSQNSFNESRFTFWVKTKLKVLNHPDVILRVLKGTVSVYIIIFTQPLRSGRIGHKVNF